MSYPLLFAHEFEIDFADAFAWYEQKRIGLGDEFLTRIDESIFAIQQTPELFPLEFKQYRRCLVQKFPYAVFFEIENDIVMVYGIFHTSRDPQKWKKRLK